MSWGIFVMTGFVPTDGGHSPNILRRWIYVCMELYTYCSWMQVSNTNHTVFNPLVQQPCSIQVLHIINQLIEFELSTYVLTTKLKFSVCSSYLHSSNSGNSGFSLKILPVLTIFVLQCYRKQTVPTVVSVFKSNVMQWKKLRHIWQVVNFVFWSIRILFYDFF